MGICRTLSVAAAGLLLFAAVVIAQEKQLPSDDVIRISTELVQTGVVVVDKQGRFVEGLKPEQFLLKVAGQPVTPAFFEHVIAGSAREEKLERSISNREAGSTSAVTPSFRGRTVIFFIDDLHLSADSVQRTKKAIMDFAEHDMSLEDQVAVVSPSGNIGFLQRFSDLKSVVNAAVNRLTYKPYTVRDSEQIPMTEYQAIRIDQGDHAATDYFVGEMQKANNIRVPQGIGPPSGGPVNTAPRANQQTTGMTPEAARRLVRDRASFLLRQSESVTSGTLNTLESLMRSVAQLPGRKVVFLISDGFFLNERSTGYATKINQITNAAMRGGLVIYSVDARGLTSMIDASSNRADPIGQLARANIGELAASQDGMNALAADTGGKAFFNTPLTTAVKEGLRETSNYYLLAWRPATEDQKSADFKRLEVSIVGRPDLTVRLPRGFFLIEPKEINKDEAASDAASISNKDANPKSNSVETALMSALAAPSSRTGMPTKLAVSFVDAPGSGPLLTAATQISTEDLDYSSDKQPAAIDLAGIVLNDQGKQAGSFKTRINVNRLSQPSATRNPAVVYSHKLPLKPGIYQIRVAARENKSGRVGSAAQWIEIPELRSKKLSLSTLLLGGQFVGAGNQSDKGEQVLFSVDHRFPSDSQMTFLTIIYNAVAGSAPRLDSQIEILRAGQRVIASPVRPIPIEPNTDLSRIPYGGMAALKSLQPGRYVLRVTVFDRNANASTFNQVLFDVE
jgi:VWFA-related protein